MNKEEKYLNELLEILNSNKILPNVILIWSWCLFFYKNIFNNFTPILRTIDIDFYVPDVKRIKGENGLINKLKIIKYDMIVDTLTNKTKFVSPDGFELEFLTRLNRNHLACVKLGNTGIYAESLSYLDIFNGNYIEIEYNNIIVKIASPSSYVLQKLLIINLRKAKKEKDIQSINYVLSFIKTSKKNSDELIELFSSLPKKWQNKIQQNCKENKIVLFD